MPTEWRIEYHVSSTSIGVVFNSEEIAERVSNVVSLPAQTAEAKQFGTIVVALKGEYIRKFADHLDAGTQVVEIPDIVDYCTSQDAQTNFEQFTE